jgi:hypothetical protein
MALIVKDGAGSNRTLKTTVETEEHISHHNIDTHADFGKTNDDPAASDTANDTMMAFVKRKVAKLTEMNTQLGTILDRLYDSEADKNAGELLALILAEATSIDTKTVDYSTVLDAIATNTGATNTTLTTISADIATLKADTALIKADIAAIKAVMSDIHADGSNSIRVTETAG